MIQGLEKVWEFSTHCINQFFPIITFSGSGASERETNQRRTANIVRPPSEPLSRIGGMLNSPPPQCILTSIKARVLKTFCAVPLFDNEFFN